MKTLNLKAVASAFAALALTVVLSWTFVDATSLARVHAGRRRTASWPPSVLWYARSPEHSDGPAVGRQPADLQAAA